MKIHKDDTVLVISGKDRGKTGKVEKIFPKKNKLIVTGINIVTKHTKPTKKNPKGGIIEITAPIHVSNLKLICPKCAKATRVGYKIQFDSSRKTKTKMRICKKCGEEI